jgi:hypothetical protein
MRSPFVQTALALLVSLFLMVAIPATSGAQTRQVAKPVGAEPTPESAVSAILAAFDKYEIVGMPEAHDLKDIDDFIFSLIRNPMFPQKVNDIEVECGNSLYQPILDRYIAGEDVPFTEVRKVWRNTTQDMCGDSQFFGQFFPLVRAINSKLPPERRLRVLAGDPPIDWDQVKTPEDAGKFFGKNSSRDASIASVLEKETLSKHRKALMLFGTFHLMHGLVFGPNDTLADAVTIYEKNYPGVTFVISDLGFFDTDLPSLSSSPFANWPVPSLARIKGTWLGALNLAHFLPGPISVDVDCKVRDELPEEYQRSLDSLVDAVLYLGPQDLRLREELPADVVLDANYRAEVTRRQGLAGLPVQSFVSPSKENDQRIMNRAANPMFVIPRVPDAVIQGMVQTCFIRKNGTNGAPK